MTERVFNFSPGPAVLPVSVLETARDEMLSLPGVGMSILEISHRSKAFDAILAEATESIRELLGYDDIDIVINPADLKTDVYRSSGAGGRASVVGLIRASRSSLVRRWIGFSPDCDSAAFDGSFCGSSGDSSRTAAMASYRVVSLNVRLSLTAFV